MPLRVENAETAFTRGYVKGQVITIPVAHHDGNYFADKETLKEIEDGGQVAFRYAHPTGMVDDAANPNGSLDNIAGVFNKRRTILGMMPHPERLADLSLGGLDGKPMFDGLVEALG